MKKPQQIARRVLIKPANKPALLDFSPDERKLIAGTLEKNFYGSLKPRPGGRDEQGRMIVTTSVDDIINSPIGHAIIKNSAIKIILSPAQGNG